MSAVSGVDAFQTPKEAPHVVLSALLAVSRDAAASPAPALLPKDEARLRRVRGTAPYAMHLAADQLLAAMTAAGHLEYPMDLLLLSTYGAARLITATRTRSVRLIRSLPRLSANTRAAPRRAHLLLTGIVSAITTALIGRTYSLTRFKALPARANQTGHRGQGGPVRSPCPRE
jgi:hypothetical protein